MICESFTYCPANVVSITLINMVTTMKLLAVAGFLLFIVSIEVRTNVVQASTRLSFLTDPQNLEPFHYVTITGDVLHFIKFFSW